jgi:hypothetical protein
MSDKWRIIRNLINTNNWIVIRHRPPQYKSRFLLEFKLKTAFLFTKTMKETPQYKRQKSIEMEGGNIKNGYPFRQNKECVECFTHATHSIINIWNCSTTF